MDNMKKIKTNTRYKFNSEIVMFIVYFIFLEQVYVNNIIFIIWQNQIKSLLCIVIRLIRGQPPQRG